MSQFYARLIDVLLHRICSDQIFVPDLFWIPVLPLTKVSRKQAMNFMCFIVLIKFLGWHAFGVITFTLLIKIRHWLNKQFICTTASYCKVAWGSFWPRSPSCFFFLLSLTLSLPRLPHRHSKKKTTNRNAKFEIIKAFPPLRMNT